MAKELQNNMLMFTHSKIEIDAGVAEQVVQHFRQLDQCIASPYGTWHSQHMSHNPFPWFQSTYDRVASAIGDLRIDGWWFNCGRAGDGCRQHTHEPFPWAAVLYVQVPENSGGIEFCRQGEYTVFQPTTGDFILSPGSVAHRVLPSLSTDPRISVAFNLAKYNKTD